MQSIEEYSFSVQAPQNRDIITELSSNIKQALLEKSACSPAAVVVKMDAARCKLELPSF